MYADIHIQPLPRGHNFERHQVMLLTLPIHNPSDLNIVPISEWNQYPPSDQYLASGQFKLNIALPVRHSCMSTRIFQEVACQGCKKRANVLLRRQWLLTEERICTCNLLLPGWQVSFVHNCVKLQADIGFTTIMAAYMRILERIANWSSHLYKTYTLSTSLLLLVGYIMIAL